MKKFLLAAALVFAAYVNNSFASTADAFAYDENTVSAQLTEATQIENYVAANGDVTFTELQADANAASALNLGNFNANTASFTFDDMNWKAFLWGFCCWPIGIFTVLIKSDSTREDKISFVIGAAIWWIGGILGKVSYTP
jgi:hypothetical protein